MGYAKGTYGRLWAPSRAFVRLGKPLMTVLEYIMSQGGGGGIWWLRVPDWRVVSLRLGGISLLSPLL